jgi:hypothetical protein
MFLDKNLVAFLGILWSSISMEDQIPQEKEEAEIWRLFPRSFARITSKELLGPEALFTTVHCDLVWDVGLGFQVK